MTDVKGFDAFGVVAFDVFLNDTLLD